MAVASSMRFFSLAALLCLTSVADARLGETLAECGKRYGKQTEGKHGCKEFMTPHFLVVVHCEEGGKCDFIIFRALEPKAWVPKSRPITVAERKELLDANSNSQHFRVIAEGKSVAEFATEDRKLEAILFDSGSRLAIYTQAGKKSLSSFMDAIENESKATTEGF